MVERSEIEIKRLGAVASHILAGTDPARDDGAVDRRVDRDQRVDDPVALDSRDFFLVAADDDAQLVARRLERALAVLKSDSRQP